MKNALTFKHITKSIIISLILSIIAYFIAPYLGITADSARLVTYSVLVGAFISSMLAVIPMEFSLVSPNQVSVFVGNLAFKAGANDLRELFEEYGNVQGVRVMTDRATRRPKGFAFVEMDKKGAKTAIAELDGAEFFGRDIKVNYATRRKSAA